MEVFLVAEGREWETEVDNDDIEEEVRVAEEEAEEAEEEAESKDKDTETGEEEEGAGEVLEEEGGNGSDGREEDCDWFVQSSVFIFFDSSSSSLFLPFAFRFLSCFAWMRSFSALIPSISFSLFSATSSAMGLRRIASAITQGFPHTIHSFAFLTSFTACSETTQPHGGMARNLCLSETSLVVMGQRKGALLIVLGS